MEGIPTFPSSPPRATVPVSPAPAAAQAALAQAKALIAREAKAARVGAQFSNTETKELLRIVKARLPIGSEAWKEC